MKIIIRKDDFMLKKIICAVTSLSMTASAFAVNVSAQEDAVTRGEVCSMLMSAADDYNPQVKKTDILKGYEDGELHEERNVTRAEAVVMLSRAFGDFPKLEGYNAYYAIPKEEFTDIPYWANDEMNKVFDAGLTAGKKQGIFAPYDNVTKEEMNLWIERVYALFGTNLKDNFYTSVNHDELKELKIGSGKYGAGKVYDMDDTVSKECRELIKKAASSNAAADTPEGKIKILYNNMMDKESRNKDGIAPVKGYLDELETLNGAQELADFACRLYKETGKGYLFGFGLEVDAENSDSYVLSFSTPGASFAKEAYTGEADYLKEAYTEYAKTVFSLGGDSDESAAKKARLVWDFQTQISKESLDPEEYYDVDKTYNIFSLKELDELYKSVDMQKVFDSFGYKNKDRICVTDTGALKKNAELLSDDNVEMIKANIRLFLLAGYVSFGDDFRKAADKFNEKAYGVSGTESDDVRAAESVKNILSLYMEKMYKDAYYSQETADKITKVIEESIAVYKDRIKNLDWMSGETKEKALKKLDTMGYKVGASDVWEDYLADINLKTYDDGGSVFDNITEINKGENEMLRRQEGTKVNKDEWVCNCFTVNAFYNPAANDITIPLGYLKEPIYSDDYSYEEVLGAIGSVICHELSHAFDNSGSKYDENGNAVDWWTKEDKEAFDKLCQGVIEFFDGLEGAPGIAQSGAQTLTENIADLGAISCMSSIAAKIPDFDYKKMYEKYAEIWVSVYKRETLLFFAMTDVHSLPAIRVNRVLQSDDKFYDVYDIHEGDGMWTAPEDRVSIW